MALGARERNELVRLLKEGALAQGFATELWTLNRVGELIARRFKVRYSQTQVWRLLGSLGFQCAAARQESHRARRGRHCRVEAKALAGSKKNAAKQGRVIVFVDESGLSERPTWVRAFAPKGETPVLQYHFNWHQLSAIAGIAFYRSYFRLFPGTVKGPQIIEFLRALRQTGLPEAARPCEFLRA